MKVCYLIKKFLHRVLGVFPHVLDTTSFSVNTEYDRAPTRFKRKMFDSNHISRTHVSGHCRLCDAITRPVKVPGGNYVGYADHCARIIKHNPGWVLDSEGDTS